MARELVETETKEVLETEHRSARDYEPEVNELETQSVPSVPRLREVEELGPTRDLRQRCLPPRRRWWPTAS
jgi:hypothetical protein